MTPAVLLAVSFTVAWSFALVLVPCQVESLFRHRLWRLRDELQDRVFDEQLPDVPVVRELIDLLEALISHSKQINMADYLAFRISDRMQNKGNDDVPVFDLSELSQEQRDIFTRILHESYRSIFFKVIAGSRVGAFLLPLWLVRYRSESEPLAEPQTEFRRLHKVHYTLKAGQPSGEVLITSVG